MMTKNNKVVLGVAAGVAALAVAGVYAKRKGYLNNVNTAGIAEKFNGIKDTAMKAFNKSDSASEESQSTGSTSNGGSSKKKSSSAATTGNADNAATV